MKMQDLSGKVAVITGASSGIGEVAARLLASEGILVARRNERIAALAEERGDMATASVADVGNRKEVAKLFAMVRAKFGGLDLLFNNAGFGVFSSFAESGPEDWDAIFQTNVVGTLNCSHEALPLMKGRASAMIASVSSTGGHYGPSLATMSSRERYGNGALNSTR